MSAIDDGGTVTTHTFDALGRATGQGGSTYTYDSLDRVTSDGGVTFSYAGFEIDPVLVGTESISRSFDGSPVARQMGAGPAALVGRNSHGDVGYHFDPTGALATTTTYNPFGAVVADTGSRGALGFQGDYTNSAGDVWMGARWYRPGTGSFTARDPLLAQPDTADAALLRRGNRSIPGTVNPSGSATAVPIHTSGLSRDVQGGLVYLKNRYDDPP